MSKTYKKTDLEYGQYDVGTWFCSKYTYRIRIMLMHNNVILIFKELTQKQGTEYFITVTE